MIFFEILLEIILPIFLMIGLGFAFERLFDIDIKTLTRLNFYILTPAVVFEVLFETTLAGREMLVLSVLMLAQFAVLGLAILLASSPKRLQPYRTSLVFSVLFTNSGNYGIPLMLLVFGEIGVGVTAIILAVNAAVLYTLGVFFMSGGEFKKSTFLEMIKIPAIHATWLALVVRGLGITQLPEQIAFPLEMLSIAFIPVALIALGAQLSHSQTIKNIGPVMAAAGGRLVLAPLTAFGLAYLFGLTGNLMAMVVVASAVPTAVNFFVISSEYDHHPDLASQIVFATTLLSVITMPLVIIFTQWVT